MVQARLCRPGQIPRDVCELGQRSQRLLGRTGQARRLDQAVPQGREYLVCARQHLDQMVRGRRPQRRLELHRPASRDPRRPDRHHLGGRRPLAVEAHHLPPAARRSLQDGQHPAHPQRHEGRPRHDLSADDSGSRLRHAGLRADRRHPFGGVRRLLARQPRPAHHRLPVQDHHHRRRRPARRQEGAAEGQCRCRDRQERRRRLGRRGQAHRRRGRHESVAGFLVSRRRRDGDDGMPVRADACRGSAVHPLHLGLDRPAQGRAAHLRRLPGVRVDDASIRVRLSRRRHLLVHRRRRLGHRPQLHSLWAAGQRRDHADVRGRAELPRHVQVLERDRQAQGQHLLHRADRDPGADAGR